MCKAETWVGKFAVAGAALWDDKLETSSLILADQIEHVPQTNREQAIRAGLFKVRPRLEE
jgi:hypothetical protein